ncbi:MAG: hypothetical protein C5B51_21840 [Terriglobia bacterium]|nr:MAG: hypothetical protein C5B51_21840 [Terriglobia bacterium]
MRSLASVKLVLAFLALSVAPPLGDRSALPVAVLLDAGMNATITTGGERETPLHAVKGELILPGARLLTGGQGARFLYLPDSNIYQFSPIERSFPAPAYVAVEAANTAFEVRFTTLKPSKGRGTLTAVGQWPLAPGTMDFSGVIPTRGTVDAALLKSIEAELNRPGNAQNSELRLARAITLERGNQLDGALDEYKSLAGKEWSAARWLQKKLPDLVAAGDAARRQRELASAGPRTVAVVVGISDYQRLPRLDYAANDARLFAEYLTSPQGGGFPARDVVVFTDRQATTAAVSSALEQVFSGTGANDTVILFFSGYAMSQRAENLDEGFLLASDSDPQEKKASAYSISGLSTLVRTKSGGTRLVVLADTGRMPVYQDSPNQIGSVAPAELANDRVAGMLANGDGEPSQFNTTPVPQGLFTSYLVQGLRANGGIRSLEQVLSDVDRQVRMATNEKQHPVRFGMIPPNYTLRAQGRVAAAPPAPNQGLIQLASLGLRPGLLFAPQVTPTAAPAIAYEEQGQQILLQYLRGNDTPPSQDDFRRGSDLFARAYQSNAAVSLEAKQQFFEGRALTFNDDVDLAIPLLESAIRLDPDAAYGYNGLGIAYLKKGMYPEAAWSFRDAILRASNWIYPRHNLAFTYMQAGAYGPAEQIYREAIRLETQSASLHYGFGLLLQRTNRSKEAGRQYREALRINPNYALAHTALGVVLADEGKVADAMNEHNRALMLDPRLAAAWHNLALLYARRKNDAEARRLWLESIKADPKFVEARVSLAGNYAAAKEYDSALDQYRLVLQTLPNYTAIQIAEYETEGDRSAGRGQKQDALSSYQKALDLTQDPADRRRLNKKLKQVQK